jgi:tRNA-splicing ligase RtcB (3'-phosphate/5'-hydroxy nucleic acid ligase)
MFEMEIKKISKNIYEIPKKGKMNVQGIVYASEKIMKDIEKDKTLEQIKNVASLPGILKSSIALADAHQGYGFSIGGVAGFDLEKGIICPGGIGYDINCSVRLLKTNLTKKDILENQKKIVEALYRKIPSGVGRGSKFQITYKELDKLLEGGAKYIIGRGYGEKEDSLYIEEEGCMKEADSGKISERAKKRGIGQIGTLGAGNHFLEIGYVDEIFDEKIAKVFGLKKNQVTIMIHCGSRGLGHQVASDYIKKMEEEYGFENLEDRELINAPIKSKLGEDYFSAMAGAANFAFANKQLITHWIREEMKYFFPKIKINVIYDICHNIAKFEEHNIKGKKKIICVHRKGATRSFGPGRKEIPEKYKKIGQPVIIPGSMGTSSYLLVGTKKAEELSFGSSVHGAGRVRSRSSALKIFNGEKIKKELYEKNIEVKSGSFKSLAEESPEVYKDIDEVVKVVDELGINKKVLRLKPLGVIKG